MLQNLNLTAVPAFYAFSAFLWNLSLAAARPVYAADLFLILFQL